MKYIFTFSIMKKATLIFTIICLATVNSFAQKTHLDIFANLTNSNFNYGDSQNQLKYFRKKAIGLRGGLAFQGGVTPLFSMVSELYYQGKGGELKTGNPLTIESSTVRLHAIEMPVMARFHLYNGYLNAGPSVSYNLSGKIKIGGNSPGSSKVVFNDSPNGFSRWEAGIQLGAGYQFHFKKVRLALDVRYVHGLTSLSNNVERFNRAVNITLLLSKPWKNNPLAAKKFK